jgi:hypothetical protein
LQRKQFSLCFVCLLCAVLCGVLLSVFCANQEDVWLINTLYSFY